MSKAKVVYVSGKVEVEVRRTLFGQKIIITDLSAGATAESPKKGKP